MRRLRRKQRVIYHPWVIGINYGCEQVCMAFHLLDSPGGPGLGLNMGAKSQR